MGVGISAIVNSDCCISPNSKVQKKIVMYCKKVTSESGNRGNNKIDWLWTWGLLSCLCSLLSNYSGLFRKTTYGRTHRLYPSSLIMGCHFGAPCFLPLLAIYGCPVPDPGYLHQLCLLGESTDSYRYDSWWVCTRSILWLLDWYLHSRNLLY